MIAGKEKVRLLTIHFRMSWFEILMMRIINLVYRAKIRLMLHLLRRLTHRMTLAIMMRIKMIWRRKNMTALKRMLWCFTISWRMASRLFLSITIEDLSRFIKHFINLSTTRLKTNWVEDFLLNCTIYNSMLIVGGPIPSHQQPRQCGAHTSAVLSPST